MKRTKGRKIANEDERFRVHARAWINLDGRPFLGPGKVRLLRAVDEVGSIAGAARMLGLSYRAAWNRVDAMNNNAGVPLIETSAGGEGGGGARLTDLGRKAIAGYTELTEALARFCGQIEKDVLPNFADFPPVAASPADPEEDPEP